MSLQPRKGTSDDYLSLLVIKSEGTVSDELKIAKTIPINKSNAK